MAETNNVSDGYDHRWMLRHIARAVVSPGGCWLWTKSINKTWGYACVQYRGRTVPIHRQMFKVTRGLVLVREQYVCHTCDVRNCFNPAHLWLGSNSENQKDSSRKDRHYESRRSHCERGHEFTPENTYWPKTGRQRRSCKTCQRARIRINAGWPADLAYSMPAVSPGQRPVGGHFPRKAA